MKTRVHKSLSWLLSLCMIVMLLPISAFAAEVLSTPTGLAWDEAKATWSAVDNVSSYTVQLYKGEDTSGDPITGISNAYYDFTNAITETDAYYFTVTAVGDEENYTSSSASERSAAYNYTAPSTDASLSTVLEQEIANDEEHTGAGTDTAKTASIDVAYSTETVGLSDIAVAADASFNLYSDSNFSSEIENEGTISLNAGEGTTAYIKVTAQSGAVLYYAVTITRAAASTDASLSTVLEQEIANDEEHTGAGTDTAKTASIDVAYSTETVGLSDIAVAENASFNLYSDSNFSSEIENEGTISLNAGEGTTAYIKVTAQSGDALYYAVTITRAAAPTEQSTAPNSAVLSNGNLTLTVTLTGSPASNDTIKVYDSETEGNLLKTFTISDTETSQAITLDAAATANVWVTYTDVSNGKTESTRVESSGYEAPVADIADLTVAVSNDGTISGDTDTGTAGASFSYYLVSESKLSVIDTWNVETSADGIATVLGVSTDGSKPTLSYTDNSQYLVVVETKDGKVVAAGQSAAIDIDSPYTITAIGTETTGGAGITRTITTSGTNGSQYLVVQITEGTGDNAHVSVVMVKAEDSVTISYKTTATVQAWLADSMPILSGSAATGANIYDTKTSN